MTSSLYFNKIDETEGGGVSAGLNNSNGSMLRVLANLMMLAGEIHFLPFSMSLRKFMEMSNFSANSACVHFR